MAFKRSSAPFHKMLSNGPDPVDRINDVTIRIPGVMFMETSLAQWDGIQKGTGKGSLSMLTVSSASKHKYNSLF